MTKAPTIEQELAALGYGHRSTDQGRRSGKQEVYRLSDGEVVGLMSAHEATAFITNKMIGDGGGGST